MRILIFIFFIISGLFTGCRSNTTPIDYTIENYYPLAVGNEWTYQFITKDTILITLKIKESYEWQGKQVFVCEWSIPLDSMVYQGEYAIYWNDETVVVFNEPPEESNDTVTLEKDAGDFSRSVEYIVGKKYTMPLWKPLVEGNAWRGHRIVRVDTLLHIAGKDFHHCVKIAYSPCDDFGEEMPGWDILLPMG